MKGHIFLLSIDLQVSLKGRKLRTLRIYNDFFHFYFLNIDISLTIYVIDLKFSVCILKVLLQGRVSQFFYLGPGFHLIFFAKQFSTFHKMKTRT